jgi:hypothetical protein
MRCGCRKCAYIQAFSGEKVAYICVCPSQGLRCHCAVPVESERKESGRISRGKESRNLSLTP